MTRPRVLVAIPMFAEVLAALAQWADVDAPCGTDLNLDWTPQTLTARLLGCAGVLVAGTPTIDGGLLAACPGLRAVCSMAVGHNNIDLSACTAAMCMAPRWACWAWAASARPSHGAARWALACR